MTSDMQSLITEPTPSRRRWLKFSMRGLFVFITLVACFLGWIVHERSQSKLERQIGKKLQEQGCTVIFGGIYDRTLWNGTSNQQGWWRDLARQILGERIWTIAYPSGPENLPLLAELSNLKHLRLLELSASDLAPLAELKQLELLFLMGGSIEDLTPLAGLKKLEYVELIGVPVDDLTPLAELKQLKRLYLQSTSVSDLTPLAGLKKLQFLALQSTSVSNEQVESLQQALPNCKIVH